MADRSVTVRISAQDNFSSVIDRYNRAMGQAEQQTRRVGQAADQQQGSWNRLGTAIGGAIAAIGIRQVISFAEDFNELGTQVDITERTFAQLAGTLGDSSDLLTRLQGATGGIVDDMTLMSGASRLLSMGLAENSDEVARLTELAVRLGGAMGNDAGASIENFSLLLANESILRLDSFGISSARVRQRIDELLESGEALNRSEAFRLAVLEEGGNSLDRLGSAAAAAETPLTRLQTRLDNFFQQGAQNFAIGVNAIVGGIDAITAAAEREERALRLLNLAGVTNPVPPGQVADPNLSSATALYQLQAELRGEQFGTATPGQLAAAYQVMSIQERMNAALQEGTRWMMEQARAANQRVDAAEAAARAEQRINAARFVIEGQGGKLSRLFSQFGGTTGFDTFGELTADIEFFDPAALGQVSNQILNINAALENARALNEEGILSDDQLANFERAAERANAIAQAAVQGAEAFERMSLSQALGEGDGNQLFGGIGDEVLRELQERGTLDAAALQDAADAYNLAAGRITESSIVMRDTVTPILARIAEVQGIQVAIERTGQVEGFLRQMQLSGVNENGFAAQAGLSLSTGTLFGVDFQSTLIDPFTAAFDEIRAQVGAEEGGGGADLLSGLPTGVDKAIESAGELQTVLDEMAAREYTIKLHIDDSEIASAEGRLAAMGATINTQVGRVVRDNGGQVPGATNRGRGTRGVVPTQ